MPAIRVLLVEDNPGDAHLVRRHLSGSRLASFELEHAETLRHGLEGLGRHGTDVILLDLSLPDSSGIETFREVNGRHADLPLIVMTGLDDKELALRAVREGAQDFLTKDSLDGEQLVRAIRFAIERKGAERRLRASRDRYALAVAQEGLWDWDLRREEVFFSARWQELLGYDEGEIGSSPEEWFSRVHPSDLDKLKREISAHLNGQTPALESEHRMRTASGSYRWMLARGLAVRDDSGSARRIAGSLSDIDARKTTEQQLLHDAMHDALTGLANSPLLMDRLSVALGQARRRRDASFAVLFLDLDRFKKVNDSLGHAIGDQLLVGVAVRLQALFRPGDTVARLGGDEFAILANGIRSPSDATRLAERIHEELREPFDLDGHEVLTSTSIGIALSSSGYHRADEILRDADTAMYRAKYLGQGRHAIFDEEMHRRATELLQMETDLGRALSEGEFQLHYQPIVTLASGELKGFEALVRWRHPRRGMLAPAEFIGVAEETGLIIPIGWSVVREACSQMATWHRQLAPSQKLSISVNLSARQFQHPDLVEQLDAILSQTGLDPECLYLEIPETCIVRNPGAAVIKLKRLRECGIQLSIDDFGTGQSSLACLHELPTQTLEIDRRFIGWVTAGEGAPRVIGAIVSVARSLGMKVSAEGLETAAQLEQLRRLRCEYGQGFYFSPPLVAEDARDLIASRRRW